MTDPCEGKYDIVPRLRNYNTCSDTDVDEAADEIERLRKRLLAEENAYDIERRQNEHLQTDRNNLALEVERLRAERDEARRLYCIAFQEITENLGEKNTTESIAEEMGWDCFKEDADV